MGNQFSSILDEHLTSSPTTREEEEGSECGSSENRSGGEQSEVDPLRHRSDRLASARRSLSLHAPRAGRSTSSPPQSPSSSASAQTGQRPSGNGSDPPHTAEGDVDGHRGEEQKQRVRETEGHPAGPTASRSGPDASGPLDGRNESPTCGNEKEEDQKCHLSLLPPPPRDSPHHMKGTQKAFSSERPQHQQHQYQQHPRAPRLPHRHRPSPISTAAGSDGANHSAEEASEKGKSRSHSNDNDVWVTPLLAVSTAESPSPPPPVSSSLLLPLRLHPARAHAADADRRDHTLPTNEENDGTATRQVVARLSSPDPLTNPSSSSRRREEQQQQQPARSARATPPHAARTVGPAISLSMPPRTVNGRVFSPKPSPPDIPTHAAGAPASAFVFAFAPTSTSSSPAPPPPGQPDLALHSAAQEDGYVMRQGSRGRGGEGKLRSHLGRILSWPRSRRSTSRHKGSRIGSSNTSISDSIDGNNSSNGGRGPWPSCRPPPPSSPCLHATHGGEHSGSGDGAVTVPMVVAAIVRPTPPRPEPLAPTSQDGEGRRESRDEDDEDGGAARPNPSEGEGGKDAIIGIDEADGEQHADGRPREVLELTEEEEVALAVEKGFYASPFTRDAATSSLNHSPLGSPIIPPPPSRAATNSLSFTSHSTPYTASGYGHCSRGSVSAVSLTAPQFMAVAAATISSVESGRPLWQPHQQSRCSWSSDNNNNNNSNESNSNGNNSGGTPVYTMVTTTEHPHRPSRDRSTSTTTETGGSQASQESVSSQQGRSSSSSSVVAHWRGSGFPPRLRPVPGRNRIRRFTFASNVVEEQRERVLEEAASVVVAGARNSSSSSGSVMICSDGDVTSVLVGRRVPQQQQQQQQRHGAQAAPAAAGPAPYVAFADNMDGEGHRRGSAGTDDELDKEGTTGSTEELQRLVLGLLDRYTRENEGSRGGASSTDEKSEHVNSNNQQQQQRSLPPPGELTLRERTSLLRFHRWVGDLLESNDAPAREARDSATTAADDTQMEYSFSSAALVSVHADTIEPPPALLLRTTHAGNNNEEEEAGHAKKQDGGDAGSGPMPPAPPSSSSREREGSAVGTRTSMQSPPLNSTRDLLTASQLPYFYRPTSGGGGGGGCTSPCSEDGYGETEYDDSGHSALTPQQQQRRQRGGGGGEGGGGGGSSAVRGPPSFSYLPLSGQSLADLAESVLSLSDHTASLLAARAEEEVGRQQQEEKEEEEEEGDQRDSERPAKKPTRRVERFNAPAAILQSQPPGTAAAIDAEPHALPLPSTEATGQHGNTPAATRTLVQQTWLLVMRTEPVVFPQALATALNERFPMCHDLCHLLVAHPPTPSSSRKAHAQQQPQWRGEEESEARGVSPGFLATFLVYVVSHLVRADGDAGKLSDMARIATLHYYRLGLSVNLVSDVIAVFHPLLLSYLTACCHCGGGGGKVEVEVDAAAAAWVVFWDQVQTLMAAHERSEAALEERGGRVLLQQKTSRSASMLSTWSGAPYHRRHGSNGNGNSDGDDGEKEGIMGESEASPSSSSCCGLPDHLCGFPISHAGEDNDEEAQLFYQCDWQGDAMLAPTPSPPPPTAALVDEGGTATAQEEGNATLTHTTLPRSTEGGAQMVSTFALPAALDGYLRPPPPPITTTATTTPSSTSSPSVVLSESTTATAGGDGQPHAQEEDEEEVASVTPATGSPTSAHPRGTMACGVTANAARRVSRVTIVTPPPQEATNSEEPRGAVVQTRPPAVTSLLVHHIGNQHSMGSSNSRRDEEEQDPTPTAVAGLESPAAGTQEKAETPSLPSLDDAEELKEGAGEEVGSGNTNSVIGDDGDGENGDVCVLLVLSLATLSDPVCPLSSTAHCFADAVEAALRRWPGTPQPMQVVDKAKEDDTCNCRACAAHKQRRMQGGHTTTAETAAATDATKQEDGRSGEEEEEENELGVADAPGLAPPVCPGTVSSPSPSPFPDCGTPHRHSPPYAVHGSRNSSSVSEESDDLAAAWVTATRLPSPHRGGDGCRTVADFPAGDPGSTPTSPLAPATATAIVVDADRDMHGLASKHDNIVGPAEKTTPSQSSPPTPPPPDTPSGNSSLCPSSASGTARPGTAGELVDIIAELARERELAAAGMPDSKHANGQEMAEEPLPHAAAAPLAARIVFHSTFAATCVALYVQGKVRQHVKTIMRAAVADAVSAEATSNPLRRCASRQSFGSCSGNLWSPSPNQHSSPVTPNSSASPSAQGRRESSRGGNYAVSPSRHPPRSRVAASPAKRNSTTSSSSSSWHRIRRLSVSLRLPSAKTSSNDEVGRRSRSGNSNNNSKKKRPLTRARTRQESFHFPPGADRRHRRRRCSEATVGQCEALLAAAAAAGDAEAISPLSRAGEDMAAIVTGTAAPSLPSPQHRRGSDRNINGNSSASNLGLAYASPRDDLLFDALAPAMDASSLLLPLARVFSHESLAGGMGRDENSFCSSLSTSDPTSADGDADSRSRNTTTSSSKDGEGDGRESTNSSSPATPSSSSSSSSSLPTSASSSFWEDCPSSDTSDFSFSTIHSFHTTPSPSMGQRSVESRLLDKAIASPTSHSGGECTDGTLPRPSSAPVVCSLLIDSDAEAAAAGTRSFHASSATSLARHEGNEEEEESSEEDDDDTDVEGYAAEDMVWCGSSIIRRASLGVYGSAGGGTIVADTDSRRRVGNSKGSGQHRTAFAGSAPATPVSSFLRGIEAVSSTANGTDRPAHSRRHLHHRQRHPHDRRPSRHRHGSTEGINVRSKAGNPFDGPLGESMSSVSARAVTTPTSSGSSSFEGSTTQRQSLLFPFVMAAVHTTTRRKATATTTGGSEEGDSSSSSGTSKDVKSMPERSSGKVGKRREGETAEDCIVRATRAIARMMYRYTRCHLRERWEQQRMEEETEERQRKRRAHSHLRRPYRSTTCDSAPGGREEEEEDEANSAPLVPRREAQACSKDSNSSNSSSSSRSTTPQEAIPCRDHTQHQTPREPHAEHSLICPADDAWSDGKKSSNEGESDDTKEKEKEDRWRRRIHAASTALGLDEREFDRSNESGKDGGGGGGGGDVDSDSDRELFVESEAYHRVLERCYGASSSGGSGSVASSSPASRRQTRRCTICLVHDTQKSGWVAQTERQRQQQQQRHRLTQKGSFYFAGQRLQCVRRGSLLRLLSLLAAVEEQQQEEEMAAAAACRRRCGPAAGIERKREARRGVVAATPDSHRKPRNDDAETRSGDMPEARGSCSHDAGKVVPVDTTKGKTRAGRTTCKPAPAEKLSATHLAEAASLEALLDRKAEEDAIFHRLWRLYTVNFYLILSQHAVDALRESDMFTAQPCPPELLSLVFRDADEDENSDSDNTRPRHRRRRGNGGGGGLWDNFFYSSSSCGGNRFQNRSHSNDSNGGGGGGSGSLSRGQRRRQSSLGGGSFVSHPSMLLSQDTISSLLSTSDTVRNGGQRSTDDSGTTGCGPNTAAAASVPSLSQILLFCCRSCEKDAEDGKPVAASTTATTTAAAAAAWASTRTPTTSSERHRGKEKAKAKETSVILWTIERPSLPHEVG